MKKALLLLFFVSLNAISQNVEIYMKDGSKIIGVEDYFDVSVKPKSVGYKPEGKKWEKRVDVEDLDYAIVDGELKFKSFGSRGYFVLAEQNGKYLACQVLYTVMGYNTVYKYTIMVFDEQNKKGDEYKKIDEIVFNRQSTKGKAIDRSKVPDFVKKHFSNCEEINKRFEKHVSDDDEFNIRVCEICDHPVYKNCN